MFVLCCVSLFLFLPNLISKRKRKCGCTSTRCYPFHDRVLAGKSARCRNYEQSVDCTVETCDHVGTGQCRNQNFKAFFTKRNYDFFTTRIEKRELDKKEKRGKFGVFSKRSQSMRIGLPLCMIDDSDSRVINASNSDRKNKFYRIELDYGERGTLLLDMKGTIAGFINHSCVSNCEIQQWNQYDPVQERYIVRYFIVTKRKIAPGEEITFDYKWEYDNEEEEIKCKCGSGKKCRKKL